MAKVMPVYEQMYNVEYPLPKLDLLAVSSIPYRLYQWPRSDAWFKSADFDLGTLLSTVSVYN